MSIDLENTGNIENSDVKRLLEMVDIKYTEAEMFKMISDLDPSNEGTIAYNDFK